MSRATPMSKRRAKHTACNLAHALLQNYLEIGQPYGDCYARAKGWIPEDGDVIADAIDELMRELERRSGEEKLYACP